MDKLLTMKSSIPRLLMCPPDYFQVDYSINPWMSVDNQAIRDIAKKEWQLLYQTYLDLGCHVEVLPAAEGWPDLVFTANAALVVGPKKVWLSRFRHPERQGEALYNLQWFQADGWEIFQTNLPFEGQGEAFIWNNQLLAGYGFRSPKETIAELATLTDLAITDLELVDPRYYHLDMSLAPISNDLIAYNPAAFSKEANQKIQQLGCQLIPISEADAAKFAANLVVIDQTIIMAEGATELPDQLRQHGYQVIELPMTQFQKSGGGVRCLTLNLN